MAAAPPPQEAAAASRLRILAAGARWYQILGVSVAAPPEDIRSTFRKLALQHHPDKGGDADIFRKVQQAYEEGMLKSRVRLNRKGKEKARAKGRPKKAAATGKASSKSAPSGAKKAAAKKVAQAKVVLPKAKTATTAAVRKAAPTASAPSAAANAASEGAQEKESANGRVPEAPKAAAPAAPPQRVRKRPKPVALDASKAKLRNAVEKWQASQDYSQKTMPDEVPTTSAEIAATLLREGKCMLVDAREEHEGACGCLPGAISLPFIQVLTEPEIAAPTVAKLRAEKRSLVLFSQQGERMGRCSLLGTLLLDVFGFEDGRVSRLEGGYRRWRELADSDPLLRAEEALASALQAQAAADSLAAVSGKAWAAWDSAAQEHWQKLVDGTFESEADVRTHLGALAPQLNELEFEDSLKAMLSVAAAKAPSERGPFDEMAFGEASRRFDAKLGEVRSTHEANAAAAQRAAAQVETARQQVEEASRPPNREESEPSRPAGIGGDATAAPGAASVA